jgi:hypothetical protein
MIYVYVNISSTNVTLSSKRLQMCDPIVNIHLQIKLLGVPIYQTEHYRTEMNIKKQWIDYNPACYGVTNMITNCTNIAGNESELTVLYTKEEHGIMMRIDW